MVLCVLQNQPQMELGASSGQPANRKRKRKLSAPARRQVPVYDEYEIARAAQFDEPKLIKLDESAETARANCSSSLLAASPLPDTNVLPKQEVDADSFDGTSMVAPIDEDVVTKVEIVEVGPAKPTDEEEEEFDEFAGLPEILRNQAKSKRARARAAAEARLNSIGSVSNMSNDASDNVSNRSSGTASPPSAKSTKSTPQKSSSAEDNKYYKNMSRERRLIANARERTRVHTISTAFDALRQAIPTYSYNQKLSKLAILRIASAYIKSLSAMTEDPDDLVTEAVMGLNDEPVESKTNFSQCVADCTKTLQMECRARSRRKGGRKE